MDGRGRCEGLDICGICILECTNKGLTFWKTQVADTASQGQIIVKAKPCGHCVSQAPLETQTHMVNLRIYKWDLVYHYSGLQSIVWLCQQWFSPCGKFKKDGCIRACFFKLEARNCVHGPSCRESWVEGISKRKSRGDTKESCLYQSLDSEPLLLLVGDDSLSVADLSGASLYCPS